MFKSYFDFSKKELNGILMLCGLIFLILIFPWIYNYLKKDEVYHFDDFDLEVKEFLATAEKNSPENYYKTRDEIEDLEVKAKYFYFDPNGLPIESWRKLGLSAKQIKGIKNYEAKGGKFYSNKDVKKMYTISARQYASLEPYIRIIATEKKHKTFDESRSPGYVSEKFITKVKVKISVDLNLADSAELETLSGIGPAFAERIIKFRTRLGGFHRKEQLLDIYGLDSIKFEGLKNQVTVDPEAIKKININTVTFDEFKNYPYLTYKQMNAVIQYRKQHGSYRSLGDLKKIAIMNEGILRKIEPYLIFNDPD